MIQGSDPAETKGLISYFLKIGKENLGIFRSNEIKIYKDPGSEVIKKKKPQQKLGFF